MVCLGLDHLKPPAEAPTPQGSGYIKLLPGIQAEFTD